MIKSLKKVRRDVTGSVIVSRCAECSHVVVVHDFHTLSVEGVPTLGKCPYYKDGQYCVLLSQKGCEHFKSVQDI